MQKQTKQDVRSLIGKDKTARMLCFVLSALLLFPAFAQASDWLQWHGPNRDAKSTETGLLKAWPESGPALERTIEGLGIGWSSPCVMGNRLYSTGEFEGRLRLMCFDISSPQTAQVWNSDAGPAFTERFPGSRAMPIIDEDNIYLMSGTGRLAAFNIKDGSEIWNIDFVKKFKGVIPRFGFSECPVIDGDKLICTPGGPDAAIVAINKRSSETIWTTVGLSDPAAFAQGIIIECQGVRQFVNMTGKALVGVRVSDGQLLWSYKRPANPRMSHISTPIYRDNRVFAATSYNLRQGPKHATSGGAALLVASATTWSASEVWNTNEMKAHHGGYVLIDGYIYGNNDRKGWTCLEFDTGKVMYKEKGIGKGSILYADGMLYMVGERGTVGLTPINPAEHKVVSSFKLPDVTERKQWEGVHRYTWAHPVIADGRLYLRSMNRIYVYNIKQT
jgi:outer membrane protein assembly factor BamB